MNRNEAETPVRDIASWYWLDDPELRNEDGPCLR